MELPTPEIFTSVINRYLPEPHASLLNGILFGISLNASKDLFDNLKTTGLLHIVVLSGMNISIAISIIGLFTKTFSKIFSIIICLFFIVCFVLFVGAKPPIVRAAVMGSLSLFAVVFGRKAIPLYLLLLSALIVLLFKAEWAKSVSFQLSYAATFGLILFATPKQIDNTFGRIILNELRPSLAAQVFTAPLIWFYFKQFSLISPLANVLVAWVVAPLMIFGFLTSFLGKINFYLGIIPAYISFGLLSYVLFVINALAKIPFASFSL